MLVFKKRQNIEVLFKHDHVKLTRLTINNFDVITILKLHITKLFDSVLNGPL